MVIITLITIMALIAIEVSTEYLVISIITLFSLGYVMARRTDKPSYEAMVYMILILFIFLTGLGSTSSSGLNIYASTAIIFLLLVFYKMTNRIIIGVGVVLYFFWLFWSGIKVFENKTISFDKNLTKKIILDPMTIDYYLS